MGKTMRRLKKESPYLVFLVPTLILMTLFMFYPLLKGIPYTFTNWDGFSDTMKFKGFDNYKKIFTDKQMSRLLKNTFFFAALQCGFCNVFGLLLALLFEDKKYGAGLMKTLVFTPYVISLILSSYMMQNLMFEVTKLMGLTTPFAIPKMLIPALSTIAIWRDSGYCMVIYVAALMNVDETLYEAATVDGAGPFTRFFKVTIPMIVPSITANVTLLMSWGLKVYDYCVTAVKSDYSESINVYIYKQIFTNFRAGYGQSIAIMWTIVIFVLTNTVSWALRRKEVEL